jgi:hypothetical protein
MGLFDFPRLHVFGRQMMNVGTGNNDSASPGNELTVTSDTERVQAVTRGMNDADFRQWMKSTDSAGFIRAQWNYFGDFTFRFLDVKVRSVQLGYDQFLTSREQDPLIGARVSLNHAVMIDTNPEGYHTTQVFSESLQISSRGALASGLFASRTPTRATTRWLNWYRQTRPTFRSPAAARAALRRRSNAASTYTPAIWKPCRTKSAMSTSYSTGCWPGRNRPERSRW